MGSGTWRERLARDRALGALWRVASFGLLLLGLLQLELLLLPGLATTPLSGDRLTAALVAQGMLLLAAATVAGWVMLRWVDRRPIRELGFGMTRRVPREIGVGVAIGAGALVGVVGLFALGGAYRAESEPGTVVGWLGVAASSLLWLAIPAAAEEAIFRGYPFRALVDGTGPAVALFLTSGLFAAVHGGNPNVDAIGLVNIFLAGMLLGVAMLRTGSLWFATAVHLGWNWAIAGLLDLPVSGLDLFDPPLYDLEAGAPAWLTGGAFGPEGGLAATLAVVLALGLTWRYTRAGQQLGAAGEGEHERGEDR